MLVKDLRSTRMLNLNFKKITKLLIILTLTHGFLACTSKEEEDKTVFEGEFDDVESKSANSDGLDSEDDLDEDEDLSDDELDGGSKSKGKTASNDDEDLDFEDEFAEDDAEFDGKKKKDEFSEDDAEEDLLAKETDQGKTDEPLPDESLNTPTLAEPEPTAPVASTPAPADSKKSLITSNGNSVAAEEFSPIPGMPTDDLGLADPLTALGSDPPLPPVKVSQSVSKINEDPFYRNQMLMNAVYIARPGDTVGKVSQKIYAQDKVAELLSNNSHLKGPSLDPGDKVYYNSPKRPDDKSEIKFYYQDIGLEAKIYRTKAGDNVRKLGRSLLGFEEGWKELWAINSGIQTQGRLPAGMQVKYWVGNEATLQLADNKPVQEITPPPTTTGKGSSEDIEGGGSETEDLDPPNNTGAIADKASPEPNISDPAIEEPGLETVSTVPEIPSESANVPPPSTDNLQAEGAGGKDNGLLTIGLIAIVAVAVVGLIAIQIKNRKGQAAAPGSMEFTQV